MDVARWFKESNMPLDGLEEGFLNHQQYHKCPQAIAGLLAIPWLSHRHWLQNCSSWYPQNRAVCIYRGYLIMKSKPDFLGPSWEASPILGQRILGGLSSLWRMVCLLPKWDGSEDQRGHQIGTLSAEGCETQKIWHWRLQLTSRSATKTLIANTMSFYFQPKTGGFNPFWKICLSKMGLSSSIFGVKIPKNFQTTTNKNNKNSFSRWTKFGRPETASSKSDRCESSINASCHMPVFSHALMALL